MCYNILCLSEAQEMDVDKYGVFLVRFWNNNPSSVVICLLMQGVFVLKMIAFSMLFYRKSVQGKQLLE